MIGGAFDLESARRVADGGEVDEVVPFSAGKRHGVSAAAIGARHPIHVAGERGDSDLDPFEGLVIGTGHATANDIHALSARGRREWSHSVHGEDGGQKREKTSHQTHRIEENEPGRSTGGAHEDEFGLLRHATVP